MMATNLFRSLFFICIFAALSTSCGKSDVPAAKDKASAQQETDAPAAPVVTDNSSKIMFSWFEGNEAKTALDIADIPDGVKKEVRVQDLAVPPDKRNPEWIFLANLTKKNAEGGYAVRTVHRDKYEQKRHPEQKKNSASSDLANADSQSAASQSNVIMYATPHCPHCKKARRWLLEQKIPYNEINLEKDQTAAVALAQKGQAQGVPTGGVPMFEINGRLIPGFDPAAIRKALTQPPSKMTPPVVNPSPGAAPATPSSPPKKQPAPPSAITI